MEFGGTGGDKLDEALPVGCHAPFRPGVANASRDEYVSGETFSVQ